MSIFSEEMIRYLENHSSPEPTYLQALERETYLKVTMPHMISGASQGRFLALLSKLMRPQRILEVGTFTGYSALCLAEGLPGNGFLDTIEINEERETLIRKYVEISGLAPKIRLHFGNAIEIIPQLPDTYDLAFIDADKSNYERYYHMCLSKIKMGGIIVVDNILWRGDVVRNKEKITKKAVKMQEFNQMVQEDSRVENTIIPLRDGLNLIYKK